MAQTVKDLPDVWEIWGPFLGQEESEENACVQLCLTLHNPVDCSPPGSFVHGFPRQEYWGGLQFLSLGDLPDPGIKPSSPALQAYSLQLSHHKGP